MKLIVTLMFTFFSFFQSDLESLRNSYSKANQSNENAKNFIELAEKEKLVGCNDLCIQSRSKSTGSKGDDGKEQAKIIRKIRRNKFGKPYQK